jgi:hypothetical protein
MLINRILRSLLMVAAVLTMSSCGALSPTAPEASKIKTYPAISIYAYWSGGAVGGPTDSRGDVPNFTGTYCPANSLVLENHSTRYQSVFSNSTKVLVFKNLCDKPAHLLVCVSAGSGGNFSEFPVCNIDPRTTPASRLTPIDMGPNDSGIQSTTWRETGLALSLQIYYCGVGDTFTLGAVPGANPTDCLAH